MKNRMNRSNKTISLVQHVLAIPLARYERYGIQAEASYQCQTSLADSAACSADRQALIKRVKRRIARSGKTYVLLTFNGVSGRATTYLLRRGEVSVSVAHLVAGERNDDDLYKVSLVNKPDMPVLTGPHKFAKREIPIMALGKRSEVMQTLRALRSFDVARAEYNFQIPIGDWKEIPHFDKFKLVKLIDCDCEPQNEMGYNPSCPICGARALSDYVSAMREFCEAPTHFYDKTQDEIEADGGKYTLSDLFSYESNHADIGACWDVINGQYHESMYHIVYRVESCLRAAVPVSLDDLKEYVEELASDLPLANKALIDFKVEDAENYDNGNDHRWLY